MGYGAKCKMQKGLQMMVSDVVLRIAKIDVIVGYKVCRTCRYYYERIYSSQYKDYKEYFATNYPKLKNDQEIPSRLVEDIRYYVEMIVEIKGAKIEKVTREKNVRKLRCEIVEAYVEIDTGIFKGIIIKPLFKIHIFQDYINFIIDNKRRYHIRNAKQLYNVFVNNPV